MISNIFVISRTSGVCIIHKSYSAKRQDESIISGYLTALNDFSQEIGGQTKELKMENSRLKYEFVDSETMFVFVVEETDDPNKKSQMNDAIDRVISEYRKKFPNGLNFTGNTEKYYKAIGNDILDKIMYPLALQTRELSLIIESRISNFQNNDYSQIKSDEPFDLENLVL
ncbi:MAG: hypothetical protein ACTSWR_09215 [Candidatus Helarchaeota archaeon]